jgi:hypothetical protein
MTPHPLHPGISNEWRGRGGIDVEAEIRWALAVVSGKQPSWRERTPSA